VKYFVHRPIGHGGECQTKHKTSNGNPIFVYQPNQTRNIKL
jgi:hypothetical protein